MAAFARAESRPVNSPESTSTPGSLQAPASRSTAAPSAGVTAKRTGRPWRRANSQSRRSWAGTDMTAPVPYSISTKLATHTGSAAPVSGWRATSPRSQPSRSRSGALPPGAGGRFSSSCAKASSSGSAAASARTQGCPGASAR